MVMLSELLYFDLVDDKDRRARLADLSLDLLEDDYPAVTKVYFHEDKELHQLPWADVRSVDLGKNEVRIADLQRSKVKDEGKEVLLRRDIFDALVLDLLGR